MKMVIFGRGQLGQFYSEYFGQRGWQVSSPVVDIREHDAVFEILKNEQPDVVINVAAKTNIDWCEQNKLEAFHINTLGAENVGLACAHLNIYLLHVSSGCIQESKTIDDVWKENDPVSPLCYYSWTKVWAENLLTDLVKDQQLRLLVLRPRQLLSAMVSPRNAITKLLTYDKFIDVPNSCTIVEDLMWVTDGLLQQGVVGVFNVVNPGTTTPYRIAQQIKQIIDPSMQFVRISKDDLNAMTFATRVDTILSGEKLLALGFDLKPIEERLAEILMLFKLRLETEEGKRILEGTKIETKEKLAMTYNTA